jgi:SHS2 domain-containing protein
VSVLPAWRLIDHTGDIAFEVEAATWTSLLETATAAVGEVILGGVAGEALEERAIRVGGEDREDVLVAWLTEAVIQFEEDGFLARRARVELATEREARGVLLGRRLDLDTEAPDRVIKAVTYHDLRVVEGRAGAPWQATVVLDL